MAEPAFGSYARDPKTGQRYQLRPGGWEPVATEAVNAPQGFFPAAGRAAANLALLPGNLAGMQFPEQDAMNRGGEGGEAVSPVGNLLGGYAPDVAMLAAPMLGGARAAAGAVRGGSGIAERVQAGIQARAAALRSESEQAGGLGGRSVGAAEQTPESLFQSTMNARNELSDQQAEVANRLALPASDPNHINFQTIHGQLVGGQDALLASTTDPALIEAFAPERAANYVEGTNLFKDAMGLPRATKFTDNIIAQAKASYGPKYDAVRDAVTEPVLLSEPAQEVAAASLNRFTSRAVDVTQPLDGKSLFIVRRGISQQIVKAAKAGDGGAIEEFSLALDEINGAIEAQLTGHDLALLQEANGNFRTRLLLDSGKVFGADGTINLRTAATYADKIYGDRWLGFGPRGNLQPTEYRLLDFLKAANAFPESVGNSGTVARGLSVRKAVNAVMEPRKTLANWGLGAIGRRNADLNMRTINPAGYARALEADTAP